MVKRLVDLLLAVLAALVLGLPLVLVALLVKLTSAGPVLYGIIGVRPRLIVALCHDLHLLEGGLSLSMQKFPLAQPGGRTKKATLGRIITPKRLAFTWLLAASGGTRSRHALSPRWHLSEQRGGQLKQ